jgi:hypothetical protein
MGIFVGLNLSVCRRMKEMWAAVSASHKNDFQELEELMSPNNSFKNYRAILQTSSLPFIPYLGLFLSDLTAIDSGNPDRIGQNLNFAKYEMIFRVVEQIRWFQGMPYTYSVVQPLYSLLQSYCPLSENQLYAMSLWREKKK